MSQSAVGRRQSAASRGRRNVLHPWLTWPAMLVALVACAAYGITLGGGYASDDFLFLYYATHARWLDVICMALALLSKESALALPGLLALVLVWRWVAPGRLLERIVWPLVPSIAVLVLYAAWRYALFGGIGGYVTDAGPMALTITWQQLQTLFSVNVTFLMMPLNWARALREADYRDAWSWLVAISSAVLALVSLRAATSRRVEAPSAAPLWAGCAFGVLLVLVALVPSLGSRVVYLASIGVCVLLLLTDRRYKCGDTCLCSTTLLGREIWEAGCARSCLASRLPNLASSL